MAVAIVVVVDVVVVSRLHSSIWRFNMRYFFSPATPDPALPQPHQTSSCLWSPSQDERRRERGRAAERCVLFVCLLVRSVMCAAHKPLKPQRQQRHPVFPAVCLPLCRRRSLPPFPPNYPRRRLSLSPCSTAFRRFLDITSTFTCTFRYPLMSVPPTVPLSTSASSF